jgi:hypothetical protein
MYSVQCSTVQYGYSTVQYSMVTVQYSTVGYSTVRLEYSTVQYSDDDDCRTGSLHLGLCIRALCAPHWNSFLPSSPEALRTYRHERPL